MNGFENGELLYSCGIAVMIFAAVSAGIAAIVLSRAWKKLNIRLKQEFGPKRRSGK